MSLDLNDIPVEKRFEKPLPKAGVQPARVVQIVDLGVQSRPPFKGKEKAPIRQVLVNYELVADEFEFEGKKFKHRVALKPLNVVSRASEMYGNSAIANFLSSVDPADKSKGKLETLLDNPALATVVINDGIGKHKGKRFANITSVMQPPEGYNVPALSEAPSFFSFDNPDEEVWGKLPRFIQEWIKRAVTYPGSKVEALVKKLETA